MRRFILVLGSAALALLVSWPVAAEDTRREDRVERRTGAPPVWIGAMCVPVGEALRAQLQIDEGVGLAVAEIVPDSPAAKAGLKVHDVIAGIDGKPLKNVGELMDAVADAGEKPLKLELYRAGKKETLEVTPAERPRGDVPHRFGPFGDGRGAPQSPEQMREWLEKMRANLPEAEVKRMQQWIEQMQRGEHQPFQMKLFGPGVLMSGVPVFPKGVKVLIEKEADKPTKIHVERGDEKWDITEKELDQLPRDLQGPIGAMLGGGAYGAVFAGPRGAAAGAVGGSGDADVRVEIDGRPVPMHPFTIPVPPHGPPAAEFEALKRQVEQLQRRLDELNQGRGVPAKEPANNPSKEKV